MSRIALTAALVLGVSGAAWGQEVRRNLDVPEPMSGTMTMIPNCGDQIAKVLPYCISTAPLITYPPTTPPAIVLPHHYTVADIDRMRTKIFKDIMPTTCFKINDCDMRDLESIPATVEQRLQTYIAAGITADELEAAAK